jgi:hypothetical protein
VRFNSRQISPYIAVNKDAFPNSPADDAGCIKSFRLPKQAQVSRVSFQAQYQAFVRFAVGSSAALSAIALKWTCVLEPFTRAGSRSENSGLHPQYPQRASTGPATLDRCCGRNVVAPGEYSKWFFCIPIRLYGGNFRPATARQTPARSAFGGLSRINPAAVINPSTSALWPCPTSTTRAPRCASSRAACGMSAR